MTDKILSKAPLSSTLTMSQCFDLGKKVWDALLHGDYKTDAVLLSDDFLGVYASGFSEKINHVNNVKNGPIILSYKLLKPIFKTLTDELVLISYLAEYKTDHALPSIQMYITSIWQKFSDGWKNIFSQDTKKEKT